MEIRVLKQPEDVADFRIIRIEAVSDTPESFGESQAEVINKSMQDFAKHLSDHDRGDFVLGAFENGNLIGVAGFYSEQLEKMSHKGNIWGVFVKPHYRGKGVGAALLTEIICIAKKANCIRHINLTVVTSNESAVSLYENLGFTIFGTEPNAINVDSKFYDEHYMQLVV